MTCLCFAEESGLRLCPQRFTAPVAAFAARYRRSYSREAARSGSRLIFFEYYTFFHKNLNRRIDKNEEVVV